MATLPKLGGLLDPNVERLLALKPDLVIVYGTQAELKQQLERAGIPMFPYVHRGLPDVTATIRALGARVGFAAQANALADGMERKLGEIRSRVAGRPRPRTLLVFGRQQGTLQNIDASGGYGFLHDMLEAAGGADAVGDVKRESVQMTTEMVLARAPDVIVELHYSASLTPAQMEAENARVGRARVGAGRQKSPRVSHRRRRIRGAGAAPCHGDRAARAPAASGCVQMKTSCRGRAARTARGWCTCSGSVPDVEIGALLTTINEPAQRVAMHAVRVELLDAQADALGLPLWKVPIPSPCPNEVYERAMAAAVARAVAEGFTHMAFADLFLEDIRRYREEKLAGSGLTPIFPLFGEVSATPALAREMIAGGLAARLTCVNPKVLDRRFAGREFDAALLADLPPSVDPCGERGEFHTFAYAGPMFSRPIPIETGITVERDGFVFTDLQLVI